MFTMRALDFNAETNINPESTMQTAAATAPNVEGIINNASKNQRYLVKPRRETVDYKEKMKRYDLPNARIKLMFYDAGLTDATQPELLSPKMKSELSLERDSESKNNHLQVRGLTSQQQQI